MDRLTRLAESAAEGRTKAEIIRCLKRLFTREIWATSDLYAKPDETFSWSLDSYRSINAVAESFFGTLKTELLYRHSLASRHDAELPIFAWIVGWHNPERIIAGLGMRSPDEYEAALYADNANLDTTAKVGNPESSLQ